MCGFMSIPVLARVVFLIVAPVSAALTDATCNGADRCVSKHGVGVEVAPAEDEQVNGEVMLLQTNVARLPRRGGIAGLAVPGGNDEGGGAAPLETTPPYLIGAVYGLAGCAGVNDPAAAGCNIQLNSQGQNVTNAISPAQAQQMFTNPFSSTNGTQPASWPVDLVPWHFSLPLKRNAKGFPVDLDWDDFLFVRTDGSQVQPWGVTILPQFDGNEGFTVLTATPNLGAVGTPVDGPPVGPQPLTARVVGNLTLTDGATDFNIKGAESTGGTLDYMTGNLLVSAWVRAYTPAATLNYSREGQDPCPTNSTTHVVVAATMGGATRDGVNGFLANQFSLFQIEMNDGSVLPSSKYVQIADVDGDDITEICLNLDPTEANRLNTLTMLCEMGSPDERFSLPKGMKDGKFPCTKSQPAKITQVACPNIGGIFSVLCR